uniref:Alpha-galactosidase n=1 Tax=Alexandrium monilatum TaxID=311494 RepID=A0A7S4T9C2_9DINO
MLPAMQRPGSSHAGARNRVALAAGVLLSTGRPALGLDDGLAATPPMGYNTWNDLGCEALHEKSLREIAAKLKRLGLLDLGYRYFNVDDCWMRRSRNSATGHFDVDLRVFPSGMRAFGDHIHSLGFKFGLYTSRGYATCVGRQASLGREAIDAKDFAAWGVDLLKNDGCYDPDCGTKINHPWSGSGVCGSKDRKKTIQKYEKMERALNKTGRPIVHAICGWQPWYAPVGRSIGHMWRISADVRDWLGVYEATRIMEQLTEFHGPHGWNDPDMLLGSSKGSSLTVTPVQARAQFSLWAVMGAPLIIGASVLNMSHYDLVTYSNAEAIRVNQDPLGMAGQLVQSNCPAYPGLSTWLTADGTPEFEIDTKGTKDGVLCGGDLRAPNCAGCRRWAQRNSSWCGGQCETVKYKARKGKLKDACVSRGLGKPPTADTVDPPSEDNPNSFLRILYRRADMHQCQQVWARPLQDGEVAVAFVNFASQASKVQLPLDYLNLGPKATVHDLWSGGKAVVQGELRASLVADGGHVLLRLANHTVLPDGQPPGAESLLEAAGFEQAKVLQLSNFLLCFGLCALLALLLARPRYCVRLKALLWA